VLSVCGNFVFHGVIRGEVYRSVRCGGFAVHVNLYIGVFPKNEVKIIYAFITFLCKVKLYVCMYLVYVFIDYSCCVKYD
jgi:hypothetical protein